MARPEPEGIPLKQVRSLEASLAGEEQSRSTHAHTLSLTKINPRTHEPWGDRAGRGRAKQTLPCVRFSAAIRKGPIARRRLSVRWRAAIREVLRARGLGDGPRGIARSQEEEEERVCQRTQAPSTLFTFPLDA